MANLTGWFSSVLDIAGPLYGIYQGFQQTNMANAAFKGQDPFGPYRGQYANQLQDLMKDPSSITKDPGYKFQFEQGETAVDRSMAAKGLLGSGNELAALTEFGQGFASNYLQQKEQFLAELAGANISPNAGPALAGYAQGVDTIGNAITQLGYGNQTSGLLDKFKNLFSGNPSTSSDIMQPPGTGVTAQQPGEPGYASTATDALGLAPAAFAPAASAPAATSLGSIAVSEVPDAVGAAAAPATGTGVGAGVGAGVGTGAGVGAGAGLGDLAAGGGDLSGALNVPALSDSAFGSSGGSAAGAGSGSSAAGTAAGGALMAAMAYETLKAGGVGGEGDSASAKATLAPGVTHSKTQGGQGAVEAGNMVLGLGSMSKQGSMNWFVKDSKGNQKWVGADVNNIISQYATTGSVAPPGQGKSSIGYNPEPGTSAALSPQEFTDQKMRGVYNMIGGKDATGASFQDWLKQLRNIGESVNFNNAPW